MKQLYELHGPQQPYIMHRFQNYLTQLGIEEFLPVHVEHCPQSFGVVISHQSKVKISYSGDCRPSEEFAKAAMNSTLLIHEATFGDDLQNNAQDNMHSTVGEAIDMYHSIIMQRDEIK
jgi:ribonuclease Z